MKINKDDSKIKGHIANNQIFEKINNICDMPEDQSFSLLHNISIGSFIQDILEPLKFSKDLTMNVINAMLKYKKFIRAALTLNPVLVLTNTFDKVVDQTCKILDCDRSSVFLLDHK